MKLLQNNFKINIDHSKLFLASDSVHTFPFDLELEKYTLVSELSKADLIPVGCLVSEEDWLILADLLRKEGCNSKQLVVVMNIFDDSDFIDWCSWYDKFKNFLEKELNLRSCIVTNNKRGWPKNEFHQVHYDLMWNRQKALMTENDKFDTTSKVYFYKNYPKNFTLNAIQKIENIDQRKIFLCPNRIYKELLFHPKTGFRKLLKLFISDKSVILSDPSNGVILEPEDPIAIEQMKIVDTGGGGLWMPLANKYYETSYISIYVETMTLAPSHSYADASITEKTFDPLIKGHFILPFGYSGIITDIKDYGFALPDWINYDYDSIQCNYNRFAAFLEEANRLSKIPIEQLHDLYLKDMGILTHNRYMFFSRNYVPLYQELQHRFNNIPFIS